MFGVSEGFQDEHKVYLSRSQVSVIYTREKLKIWCPTHWFKLFLKYGTLFMSIEV